LSDTAYLLVQHLPASQLVYFTLIYCIRLNFTQSRVAHHTSRTYEFAGFEHHRNAILFQ